MSRGQLKSKKDIKTLVNKTELNSRNLNTIKDTLETSMKRINENTTNITQNQINVNGIGCVLLQSLINFKQKEEIITDNSSTILDLTLKDTYVINMKMEDGVFKPFRTAHYFLSGSFEVNNTTKKHKLFTFSLHDEFNKRQIFSYKHTLIGGYTTLSFNKMIKLLADPSKSYGYSFRVNGEKLKINNVDFNLFRINGTMA